jgi:ribosomal protein S18 acetylase RimI-like enzyme
MWRLARTDDDERIIALCLALYAEDPGTRAVDSAGMQETIRMLRAEPARGRVVVLDDGSGVVGYALLISYWSNELGGEVCHIDELYVAVPARGRGHASELVRSVARDGGLWGRPPPVALQLEVTPSNARARSLYERLGFAPVRNTNLRLLRMAPPEPRNPETTAAMTGP